MPLQLINFGRSAIRIFPFIPICQLILIRLSSQPQHVYGDRELSSKYMDDDGGPSYWWRDKRIKRLKAAFGEQSIEEAMQRALLDRIGPCEPELIDRFESYIRRARVADITNSPDLLDLFAKCERREQLKARVIRGTMIGVAPILIAASIGSLFSQPFGWISYGWLHYALWLVTLLAVPVSVVGLRMHEGQYFTDTGSQ